jgi:hypothetical protein
MAFLFFPLLFRIPGPDVFLSYHPAAHGAIHNHPNAELGMWNSEFLFFSFPPSAFRIFLISPCPSDIILGRAGEGMPVNEYLELQGRFSFPREGDLERVQEHANHEWEGLMRKIEQ